MQRGGEGGDQCCMSTVTYLRTSLVAWLREFCRTVEIIARTLREVVNREKLCGTSTVQWDASATWVAVRPLEEVPTQSVFVWAVGF